LADLLLGIAVDRAIKFPTCRQLQGWDQPQEAERGRQGPAVEGDVASPEAFTAWIEGYGLVG